MSLYSVSGVALMVTLSPPVGLKPKFSMLFASVLSPLLMFVKLRLWSAASDSRRHGRVSRHETQPPTPTSTSSREILRISAIEARPTADQPWIFPVALSYVHDFAGVKLVLTATSS